MRGSIIPEPLAMPPTRNVPADVSTSTAYDLGNGSVVMIARAASAWPSRDSAATAAGMPVRIASIFRLTPMTPVDATSACDGAQPTRLAASTAISRASAMPCGPVQALAQPLLVTMTCAMPSLQVEMLLRDEHRRRLGLVGREDRRRRRPADRRRRARDRACRSL